MNDVDYREKIINGRYKINELLGKGGMGTVYLGEHLGIGRQVAVKFLHREYVGSKRAVKRFFREARAAAAINHENIIDTLDLGIAEEQDPYLVMEYLEGESLSDLLNRTGPLDFATACGVMEPVLLALGAAHAKGIVHRDLKPDNIFLVHREKEAPLIKVIDFGISKFLEGDDDSSKLTHTGAFLGTPAYMSPEQFQSVQDVDHRADIYAMGMILYEILTGRLPFDRKGNSYRSVLVDALFTPPRPLKEVCPDCPEQAELVTLRALEKDADKRFQTSEEMLEVLRRAPQFARGNGRLRNFTLEMPARRGAIGDLGPKRTEANGSADIVAEALIDVIREVTPLGWTKSYSGEELKRIVTRSLTINSETNAHTAAELKDTLKQLLKESLTPNGTTPTPAPMVRDSGNRRRRWGILSGIGAVVLVTAVLLVVFWPRHNGPTGFSDGGRLALKVSSTSEIFHPALSPDGTMIVYATDESGQMDLFVTRVGGGDRVQLTNDSMREVHPDFSPDGDHIAFTRFPRDSETPEICTTPTLGGEITPILYGANRPIWSPGGQRLASIVHRSGTIGLAVSGADGSDLQVLLRANAELPFFSNISWHPDGRAVAVGRSRGGEASEIWLVPLDGRQPFRAWNDPPGVFSGHPVYSADGSGLVFASNRSGATNLWFRPLGRGGRSVQLTSGPGPDQEPSVARDGTVLFVNNRRLNQIWLHDLESNTKKLVLSRTSIFWAPTFSPDRAEIAFSSGEADGTWNIWTVSVETGKTRQLTHSKLPAVYPRFSPDGEWIFYNTWSPQPDRVWRVPRRGGPPQAITPAGNWDDEYADISPDGRQLAFARSEQGKTHIFVQSVAGGAVRRLTESEGTLPRWSPDGRWITFSRDRSNNGGVYVIDVDGAGATRLTNSGGWPMYWPQRDGIAYQFVGIDGQQRIRVVTADKQVSTPQSNLPVVDSNNPFDFSGDGRYLTITQQKTLTSELWLLEPPPQ